MAFKISHVQTPTPTRVRKDTVQSLAVAPEIVEAMEAEWKYQQENDGYTPVISGDSAAEALKNVQYAKAWGMQRKDKVTVTRLPEKAGKGDPLNLRVTLAKYDPNAAKRGRKANGNSAK